MGHKDTKISLSDDEIALLSDAGFFLKKQQLTNRIMHLFGELETELNEVLQIHPGILPEACYQKRGKISRGENYLGLPYIIIDFPAVFEKEGVCAFRTLAWWGNSFSITFHLSGKYLERYLSKIYPYLGSFNEDLQVCINPNQWEHHHKSSNYIPVKEFMKMNTEGAAFFSTKGFLKISKSIAFSQHNNLVTECVDFFKRTLRCLADQDPII